MSEIKNKWFGWLYYRLKHIECTHDCFLNQSVHLRYDKINVYSINSLYTYNMQLIILKQNLYLFLSFFYTEISIMFIFLNIFSMFKKIIIITILKKIKIEVLNNQINYLHTFEFKRIRYSIDIKYLKN